MPAIEPYSQWLSIPAAEQPPHHYRLLGLPALEANLEAIAAAVERQIRRVEAHRGEHAALCDRLIAEIRSAQYALADAQRKREYDAALQEQLSQASSSSSVQLGARPSEGSAVKRSSSSGKVFASDIGSASRTGGSASGKASSQSGKGSSQSGKGSSQSGKGSSQSGKGSSGSGALPLPQVNPPAKPFKPSDSTLDDLLDDPSPSALDDLDLAPLDPSDAATPAKGGSDANNLQASNTDKGHLADTMESLLGGDDLEAIFDEPLEGGAALGQGAEQADFDPVAAAMHDLDAGAADDAPQGRPPADLIAAVSGRPAAPADDGPDAAPAAVRQIVDPVLALLPKNAGYELLPRDGLLPGLVRTPLPVAPAAAPGKRPDWRRMLRFPAWRRKSRPQERREAAPRTIVEAAPQPAAAARLALLARRLRKPQVRYALAGGGAAIVLLAAAWMFWPRGERSLASVAAPRRHRPEEDARPIPQAASPAAPSAPASEPAAAALPTAPATVIARPLYETEPAGQIQEPVYLLAAGDAWWNLGQQHQGKERDFMLLRAGYWYDQYRDKTPGDPLPSKLAERLADVARIKDPVADVDGGPWGEALRWPVVFQDPLRDERPEQVSRFNVALGQDSGDVLAEGRRGLRVVGGHSSTAVWIREPASETYEVSLKFLLSDQGTACLWLGGSGNGTSLHQGYSLRINDTRADFTRRGGVVSSTRFRPKLQRNWPHQATVMRDGNRFLVWIDRVLTVWFEDSAPLGPPLHGRLGFGAEGGQGTSGVSFADLTVRRPTLSFEERRRLAALRIAPYPTIPPAANGEPLFTAVADDMVREGWYHSQPDFSLPVRRDQLLLCGPNGTPLVLRREPISGDFACEVTFLYVAPKFPRSLWKSDRSHQDNYLRLGGEALNLHLDVFFEPRFPPPERFESFVPDVTAGWEAALPNAEGDNAISWAQGQQRQTLAETPYYAPVAGESYVARLERHGETLRLFLNGALLLQTRQPVPLPQANLPAYVGFRQMFGGSIIQRIAAWRIVRDPTLATPAHP